MKTTVYLNDFRDAFQRVRPDNFSYDGLEALYDHLTEYEQDTDEEIELDVIAICCDYVEYENLAAFQRDYGKEYKTIDDIENETIVIRIDDEAFIIAAF